MDSGDAVADFHCLSSLCPMFAQLSNKLDDLVLRHENDCEFSIQMETWLKDHHESPTMKLWCICQGTPQ